MIWFLKKKENDPDREAQERFRTDFGLLQRHRFPLIDERNYSCRVKKHALTLEVYKKNHFAWAPSSLYQYRDICLETTLSFDEENGHAAAGVIFRYLNNENFYYFLISNRSAFRFDLLFNGHPLRLIEWTHSPFLAGDRIDLRSIARGGHFSFYIGNEWIAEIEDDKLSAGRFGLAAQNYGESEKAVVRVHSLLLESRPVAVEKAFWRWARYVPADGSSRLALARTFFEMGNFDTAAVELNKALKFDADNEEALFLFALCAVHLKIYDQALVRLDKLLDRNPEHRQAVIEKANTLYLANEFLKARDFIRAHIDDFPDASTFWNLLGNCEYALGNWEKAGAAYGEAARREPTMPLFFINQARMLEKLKQPAEALAAYLAAAHLLFREEAYDDLELILPRIIALDPQNNEVLGFQAKILFHENKKPEAKSLLETLVRAGSTDGALHYLYALILNDAGQKTSAREAFEEATRLEPTCALFWRRLAEVKRTAGQDYAAELEKASALAGDDPWVNNLSGLACLDRGDEEAAFKCFTKAHENAPDKIDIVLNLSDVLHRMGRKKEALALIDEALALHLDPRLYNHKGNLAVREGDCPGAVVEYEKAIKLDPENPLFRENCAAACLEAEMITRAEEILVKLVDSRPTASAYNLLGNLCVVRTEYLRADLCYTEGLRLEPNHRELKLNLASLALERSQYEKMKALLENSLKENPHDERALLLQKKMREKFELRYQCSPCLREWWVNRAIPLTEVGKIRGEPPPQSPAGQCPQCQKIYCVACAQKYMKEKRFVCPDCEEYLKLSDNYLRHLVMEHLEKSASPASPPALPAADV